jgi:hypothetical protein
MDLVNSVTRLLKALALSPISSSESTTMKQFVGVQLPRSSL